MNFPDSCLIKNNPPLFNGWVPTWLGMLGLVLLFIPATLISGAYSNNITEMSSGMGILSEHIMFANFAASCGLMIAGPFVFNIVRTYRFHDMMLCGFTLLMALSGICAITESTALIVLCNFLMGFVRIIVILSVIFSLAEGVMGVNIGYILTPPKEISREQVTEMNHNRGSSMNLIYMIFLSIGQLGNYVTSYIAYYYRWQYSYLAVMGMAIIAMLFVLVFMAPGRERAGRVTLVLPPISQAISCALVFISISYILTYGKTYDWFDDVRISVAGCIGILSLGVFILQQVGSKSRLIDFSVFKRRGVIFAVIGFFLAMFLASSSALVSGIMGLGLKLDTIQSAGIAKWHFLGIILGTITNVLMIKRHFHARWICAVAFSLITISALLLYFRFQTMIEFSQVFLPTVLRTTGMFMLYAFCGYFGILKLQDADRQIGTWIFLMLAFRTVLGPVAGASAYSNAIYHRTQHYVERFASESDVTSETASTFRRTQMGLMMQGRSNDEAIQMTSLSAKGNVQIQATLVALKEISGWTIWMGIGCVVFVLLFPYNRILKSKRRCIEQS
ncbi:MAG: hypothetical protein IJE12_05940 [Prevotella sp.]|nr:hypothetical protein [Prevotella sp.]